MRLKFSLLFILSGLAIIPVQIHTRHYSQSPSKTASRQSVRYSQIVLGLNKQKYVSEHFKSLLYDYIKCTGITVKEINGLHISLFSSKHPQYYDTSRPYDLDLHKKALQNTLDFQLEEYPYDVLGSFIVAKIDGKKDPYHLFDRAKIPHISLFRIHGIGKNKDMGKKIANLKEILKKIGLASHHKKFPLKEASIRSK